MPVGAAANTTIPQTNTAARAGASTSAAAGNGNTALAANAGNVNTTRMAADGNKTGSVTRPSGLQLGQSTPKDGLKVPTNGRQFMEAMQVIGQGADAKGGATLPNGMRVEPTRNDQDEVTGHTLKNAAGETVATSDRTKNPDGSTSEWARTPDGKVLGTADFGPDGKLRGGTSRTAENEKGEFQEYRFDANGFVGASQRTKTETGFRDDHMDADGKLTASIDRDPQGNVRSTTNFEYAQADGHTHVKATVNGPDGKPVGQFEGTQEQVMAQLKAAKEAQATQNKPRSASEVIGRDVGQPV